MDFQKIQPDVLEAGSIVQVGTFAELIKEPGLFQRLAERQML